MNDFEFVRQIEKDYANTAGLVIMKNGELIFEKYFDGHKSADTIHVFSVTKSITSILIGMAIDQGYIGGVDQKVLEFFPDYTVKRGEKTIQSITLAHILSMTAPYKYRSEPFTKVFGSEDWTKAALDLLGGRGSIGEFKYSTVGAQILSGVLQNATGKPMLNFAVENLFAPLGITSPQPTIIADKDAHMAFIKDKYVSGWVVDPKGTPTAGFGLTLCPWDMAKIGQLYLNEGVWSDRQLVPSSWVTESTKEHSRWDELPYGYLWWLIGPRSYAALGDSGNAIYVNKKEQVVIAIAAHFKPCGKLITELIDGYILPQIM